ncbi:MAG: ABC transporter substrate-binding protein [Brevinema sp.]
MKIFLIILFIIASCGQSTSNNNNEVVYWTGYFDSTGPGYPVFIKHFTTYTNQNPLSFEFSEDSGPPLYRDRLQRYFLQGKNGKPHLIDLTLEQIFAVYKTGQVFPLNEYITQHPDMTNYNKNLLDVLTINGNVLGIPSVVNSRLLIYRKDIFAKYNLSVPKTWAELINIAKCLKEKEGKSGFMFTTKSKEVRAFQEFMSFYFTLADNIFIVDNDTVNYIAKKEHLQQVLQLYYDLFEIGIDPNDKGQDWPIVDYGLTGGNVPMATVGPWIYHHLIEDPSKKAIIDNLAVAPIPLPPGGHEGTYMEVAGIVMNPATPTELKPKVYETLQIFTSSNIVEGHTELGAPSVRTDVYGKTEFVREFERLLYTGKIIAPINWESPQLYIVDAIQETIYKTKTVEQAATDLDQKLREYAVSQNK